MALIIGAPVFRYYPYVAGDYIPPGLRLLHITDDPQEAGRAPVGDSLLCDAVLAVEQLTELVSARPALATAVSKQPHGMAPHPAAPEAASDGLLSASQLFRAVRSAMPEETILTEESPLTSANCMLPGRWINRTHFTPLPAVHSAGHYRPAPDCPR